MPAEKANDSRLVAFYGRYLGEPSERTDVYLGFALFFGGLALGIVGLVIFLSSVTIAPRELLHWRLREIAFGLAFMGLPTFILSIVVLLPVDKRGVYASVVGTAVCGIAVGLFVVTYPQAWNVPGQDYSPLGITIYSGGLVVLVGATGAALVGHHLERRRSREATTAATSNVDPAEPAEGSVTTAEVEQDIESAVAASELTWGGVEQPKTRALELRTQPERDIDASRFSAIDLEADSHEGDQVDAAVAELRKLQGWEPKTATGQSVDDQTKALREFRAEAEPSDTAEERSRIGKFLNRFRRD